MSDEKTTTIRCVPLTEWLAVKAKADTADDLLAACKAARAHEDRKGSASEWQLIETAPRDGNAILLSDGWIFAVGWIGPFTARPTFSTKSKVWREWTPTHWMPLPEPPACP